jgi:hypothetical protein
MIQTKFNNFFTDIEQLCLVKQMDYIDAVVYWCEENDFEIENVAAAIKTNDVLMSKIQIEAENLNFLKKTARLDI